MRAWLKGLKIGTNTSFNEDKTGNMTKFGQFLQNTYVNNVNNVNNWWENNDINRMFQKNINDLPLLLDNIYHRFIL